MSFRYHPLIEPWRPLARGCRWLRRRICMWGWVGGLLFGAEIECGELYLYFGPVYLYIGRAARKPGHTA